MNIWDGFNKKRLCQFHRYNAGVAALSFSQDGTVLAIGVSYLNESEIPPGGLDEQEIYIRYVNDRSKILILPKEIHTCFRVGIVFFIENMFTLLKFNTN